MCFYLLFAFYLQKRIDMELNTYTVVVIIESRTA